jgi:hypothetical protein
MKNLVIAEKPSQARSIDSKVRFETESTDEGFEMFDERESYFTIRNPQLG